MNINILGSHLQRPCVEHHAGMFPPSIYRVQTLPRQTEGRVTALESGYKAAAAATLDARLAYLSYAGQHGRAATRVGSKDSGTFRGLQTSTVPQHGKYTGTGAICLYGPNCEMSYNANIP